MYLDSLILIFLQKKVKKYLINKLNLIVIGVVEIQLLFYFCQMIATSYKKKAPLPLNGTVEPTPYEIKKVILK